MASMHVTIVLVFTYFVGAAMQKDKSLVINKNDGIHATVEPTSWHSPSRRFAFGFLPQKDGFLVGIWIVNGTGQNTMIWTANRDSPPVSSNAMVELTNGKLVLTDNNDKKDVVDTLEPVSFASMHDSGNFVLHGEGSIAIWESFRYPTDTILGGQKLPKRGELFSKESSSNYSTGRFRLKMQLDGNLVAYPVNTDDGSPDAYWATGTNSFLDRYYLYLDNSGRLLLINELYNQAFMQLNGNYSDSTNTTIYRATLDPDGNFQLYSNTSTDPLWAALRSPCDMKSFCGFNGYCTLDDYQPSCYCLPGTDFINYAQSFDGCERNFNETKMPRRESRNCIL